MDLKEILDAHVIDFLQPRLIVCWTNNKQFLKWIMAFAAYIMVSYDCAYIQTYKVIVTVVLFSFAVLFSLFWFV